MINPSIHLEQELWTRGYLNVCGIDEVGRGPLAGPLVVGAVIINSEDQVVADVRDSKKMSEKKRDFCFEKIKELSYAWGIGIVESIEIDEIGLTKSIHKAIRLSLAEVEKKIGTRVDYLILDGGISELLDYDMKSINGGDNLHYSIAAASVIAKVTRDKIMKEYSKKYPSYGFEKHVGYGTKMHLDALEKHGPCDIHRKSFKPVAKYFEKSFS